MRALAAILALVLCATFGMAAGSEAKTKKKSKSPVFAQTALVNQSIPQLPAPSTRATPLLSTIVVGKKFKGKVVSDLNVTGIQTTGSGIGAASNLIAYLIAPNGRTLQLIYHLGDVSLGPWTLDDDTPVIPCNAATPPCRDPDATLNRPFAGTSNVSYAQNGAFPPNGALSIFNGQPMKGTWTFMVMDTVPTGGIADGTSALNQWGLQITPAKPAKK